MKNDSCLAMLHLLRDQTKLTRNNEISWTGADLCSEADSQWEEVVDRASCGKGPISDSYIGASKSTHGAPVAEQNW